MTGRPGGHPVAAGGVSAGGVSLCGVSAGAVIRAGYGLLQLTAPGLLAAWVAGRPLDSQARLIVRVLGTRQLAQACASGPAPTAAVLALGVEVDLLHAASMLGLAAISRRWRPVALASAAIAAGFAAAGSLAVRESWCHPPDQVRGVGRRRVRRRLGRHGLRRHGLQRYGAWWAARYGQAVRSRDRWADQLARHVVPGYARHAKEPA